MVARGLTMGRRSAAFSRRALLDRLHSPRAPWLPPAVGGLLALCVVSAWQVAWPPSRVAVAHILLDPAAAGASASAQEWVATQAAVIGSERVARRVLGDLGPGAAAAYAGSDTDGAAERLLSNLRVDASGQGGLVSVGFRSASPALSAQIANAFVAAYDRVSQELRAGVLAAAAASARQRVIDLRDEMDRARARLQAMEGIDLRASASALAEAARVARVASEATWSGFGELRTEASAQSVLGDDGVGRLQSVRDDYDLARQAFASSQARLSDLNAQQIFELGRPAMVVIDPAEAASAPANPRTNLVWAAVLAGAVAGLLLRRALQWIDPRVRSARDLASGLGLPVLGALVNAERAVKSAPLRWRVLRRGPIAAPVTVAAAVPALH